MKNPKKGKRVGTRRSPYYKFKKKPHVYSEPFDQIGGSLASVKRWEDFVCRLNGWRCMPSKMRRAEWGVT